MSLGGSPHPFLKGRWIWGRGEMGLGLRGEDGEETVVRYNVREKNKSIKTKNKKNRLSKP